MSTYSTTGRRELFANRQLPATLISLRHKLGHKAKHDKRFRAYTLYDRVSRSDVLLAAYKRVRSNGGSPGLDGVSFSHIESAEAGPSAYLERLQDELRNKTYRPDPVKRVFIPKPGGALRPLGIPTVRDRIVQMAVKLVIEPIFEADFRDCSYGFRPGRGCHHALEAVRTHIKAGYTEVYDLDLKACFDTIEHEKLMAAVRTRITDGSILRLIRGWLTAAVVQEDEEGTHYERPKSGTPQGGVLSPLLANIFLHFFDKAFHARSGPGQWAKARMVRYADDIVFLARYQGEKLIRWVEHFLESRMALVVNRDKSRVVRLKEDGAQFDFLGFTFGMRRDQHGRPWKYLHAEPSKKALARERSKLRAMTSKRVCFLPVTALIHVLNRHLNGWANYFNWGYPSQALRHINRYVRKRLDAHLRRRSQRRFRPPKGISFYERMKQLGLIYLKAQRRLHRVHA